MRYLHVYKVYFYVSAATVDSPYHVSIFNGDPESVSYLMKYIQETIKNASLLNINIY